MTQVRPGDTVQVHYTGRLADGTVFGTSVGGDPIQFAAGGSQLPAGVTQAVLQMQPGEKKTVTLAPEQAFGTRDPSLEGAVTLAQLPEGAQVGDRLTAHDGTREFVVWVREIKSDHAVVDGNHPLAGQTVTFDLELVSILPQQAG
jgi:peptidylprolyl isomerase